MSIDSDLQAKASITEGDRALALDGLQDWISDFRTIARIALKDNPQQLESLGMLARSA